MNDSELISIGNESFLGTSIQSIFIPSNTKIIGNNAFAFSELNSITFSNDSKLKTIGDRAFGVTQLSEITIPSSVTRIGNKAFKKCEMLTKIEFSENSQLKESPNSFINSGILSISIPPNITKESDTFIDSCSNLTSLEFLGVDLSFVYLTSYKCYELLIISFPNVTKISFKELMVDYALIEHEILLFTNPNVDFIQSNEPNDYSYL